MSVTPRKQGLKHGLVCGPKGESVFSRPLVHRHFENDLPDLFQKTATLNDDRLLGIVTGLIVENLVEANLKAFLPRYSLIARINFSQKINLLQASNLIPNTIPRGAHIIRGVRNDFAHHLEKSTFTDVKPDLMVAARTFLKEMEIGQADRISVDNLDLTELFKRLTFVVTCGLNAYPPTIRAALNTIQDETLQERLATECLQEYDRLIEEQISQPPRYIRKHKDGKYGLGYELVENIVAIVDKASLPPEIIALDENGKRVSLDSIL